MEHRVGVRAELQRLGVAVAALIAREVREAAGGRRDELLGIGAEGSGAAEGAGELREPLLPALELLRCGGAVVAPEHPEHLAEGYTGDLDTLALEGVQNPLVERGDAQRASHGRQTISTVGEGGYLRREPRQLLPRRDGLRGQLRALAGRKRKSRNLGFLRIIGDFLFAQKVTRRRHGHADSPTNSPPKTHDSQPFTI